jgi:hypothetical protein
MQNVFQIDNWTCQLVLLGSCVVLELSCNQERMSVELIPRDSPHEQAHALIQRPGCALVARY